MIEVFIHLLNCFAASFGLLIAYAGIEAMREKVPVKTAWRYFITTLTALAVSLAFLSNIAVFVIQVAMGRG